MAHSNWEADKMLDVYIYDYLLKRKWHDSAKAFLTEGKVATDPVAIDAPGGFLFEWWSVFWDIFIARTNDKHSEPAAAYIEAQQIKAREHQQQMHLQQLQVIQQRNSHLQRRDPSHPPLGSSINSLNSEGMMGQQPASLLALKMYEERMKQPHSMDTAVSPALMDANRMALLKASANPQGPIVQGNSGGLPAALQQIQNRAQMTSEIKSEVDLGANKKSMSLDPSSIYGQAILQSKSGLSSNGINQGVTSPLRGWPLTGIDHMRPSLGLQVQKPCFQTQNQFSLASQQKQLIQGQVQATQGVIGNSANYGDLDSRRLCIPRGAVNTKNGQPTRNDGSICSPVQSSSPKMKMGQMQQSSSQQDHMQQQQSQQNNRKRKPHSSSGAANSTGTGNTVGISANSPPSTHTTGDALTSTNGLNHVNNMSKGLLLYPEGTGGLGPSSNLLDDIEHFGDVGSLEDNVESFLRNDGGDERELYGGLKQSSTEPKKESSKVPGFTFEEVGCIRTKNSKVTCCHFSSDGKLLASAGHDRKPILWNMDTLQTQSTAEEHKYVITDIRFRPNSSQLITASYDSSVRLWDAANPSYSLHAYTGHRAPIMSVDFHPKTDLFCFCDAENEIGYWNINPFSCTHTSKGGTAQVRFQPRTGQYLAAASGEVVSIFDVEVDAQTLSFQGHSKQVNYICWHDSGNYLASVSQDCVKLWSISTGECIHELTSPATDFHSCVFHPTYTSLLVIGGASCLELWNTSENRRMTVSAHEDIIAGLAQSPITGMVASASHDSSVKLWK